MIYVLDILYIVLLINKSKRSRKSYEMDLISEKRTIFLEPIFFLDSHLGLSRSLRSKDV